MSLRATTSSLVLTTCLLIPTIVHAQSTEAIESDKIFANANMVLVFQVSQLEEHLDDEAKEALAKLHEWLKETIKLDSASCKEVILQFGAETYEDGLNDSVGFLFRSEEEIPSEQIDGLATMANLEEQEYNEKTYLARGPDRPPAFYISGNSLLIAETASVNALIDSEEDSLGDREIEIINNLSIESDICAQFDMGNESFQEFFPQIFRETESFDDSDCLQVIAENAGTINLTVNLDDMSPLTVTFELSDSGDIEALETAAKEFVEGIQGFAGMLQREMTRGTPSQDITDRSTTFCDSFVEMIAEPKIDSDESSVTITISNSEAAKKTLNDLVKLLVAVAEFFGNL